MKSLVESAKSSSVKGPAETAETAETANAATGDEIPFEVLEQQLTSWAANIAAAQARWLGWLGEYDRRQGWAQWGCASAAHWLSWKCGMTAAVARERVRVANALVELPLIRAAFEQGRLSYSKVRALTRVANGFNEPELCDMAIHSTGAQLEAICRGYRRSHPDRVGEPSAAHARRRYTLRDNYDGTCTVTMVLVADQARAVAESVQAEADAILADACRSAVERGAVERCAAEVAGDGGGGEGEPESAPTKRQVIDERDGIAAVRADACVALLTGTAITAASATGASSAVSMAESPAVSPTVPARPAHAPVPTDLTMVVGPHPVNTASPSDVSAETSVAQTTDVSAETPRPVEVLQGDRIVAHQPARRLCCDPRITALVESASGEPLAVGRATRLINHRLRLALMRRDGGRCQFPGCFATHNLHAHHIVHWADGGATDLANLISVCHFHHHVIHDRGWQVEPLTRRFLPPGQDEQSPGVPMAVDPVPACAHEGGSASMIEPWRWRGAHDDLELPSGRHGGLQGALHGGLGGGLHGLEPPHLDPLDLGFATEILHANEQARLARAA